MSAATVGTTEATLRDLLTAVSMTSPAGVLRLQAGPCVTLLHLTDGDLGLAESASVPGVGAHLVAAGYLSDDEFAALRDSAKTPAQLHDALVRSGTLSFDALTEVVRTSAVDVLFDLLTCGEAPIESRTWPTPKGWLGEVRVDLDAVLDRASAAAAAVQGLRADDVPVPIDPHGSVVMSDHAWQLRWLMDGSRSLRELAWQTGSLLVDLVAAEAALVAAGLCTAPPPVQPQKVEPQKVEPQDVEPQNVEPHRAASREPAARVSAAGRHEDVALPRRQRQRRPWDTAPLPATGPHPGPGDGPSGPDLDVIRRVLQGLQDTQ